MKHIEKLLEKYYNGETSIEEEEILRKFFSQKEIPEHLVADAGMFRFFGREHDAGLPGMLEQRLIGTIPGGKDARRERAEPPGRDFQMKPVLRLRYYWLSGVAAAILILAGIFVDQKVRRNSSMIVRTDTYDDPYLAYAEAKRVLYLVSDEMNRATRPLKNIDKLDAGVAYMQPVFTFGKGIQYMGKISTIEKTRELISK